MLSLLTTETITYVKFCVTNTRRQPSVAFKNIDAAALLKNVMETTTEFFKYEAAQTRQEETARAD